MEIKCNKTCKQVQQGPTDTTEPKGAPTRGDQEKEAVSGWSLNRWLYKWNKSDTTKPGSRSVQCLAHLCQVLRRSRFGHIHVSWLALMINKCSSESITLLWQDSVDIKGSISLLRSPHYCWCSQQISIKQEEKKIYLKCKKKKKQPCLTFFLLKMTLKYPQLPL